MGTWGTGISSNDVFEDIKSSFFKLYDTGLESEEISKKLILQNQELIDSEEDRHNFWFALALSQWQCKSLQEDILKRVSEIIQSGKDIDLWEELGASQSELKQRKIVLEKFLKKLKSERKTIKKRKKAIKRSSIFHKGDCLSIQLESGNYGAACVLESEFKTRYGLNLVAICDFNEKHKPDLRFFKRARILKGWEMDLYSSQGQEVDMIHWYYAHTFKKKEQSDIEVVGKIEVDKRYSSFVSTHRYATWGSICSKIVELENEIKTYGEPKKKLKLKSLRKNSWL
ncbi:MAG: hypothetical protein AAFY45_11265 [Bacteroidota bacterium]